MKNILNVIILIIICNCCSPNLNIELPNLKKQLVIDGWIENGGYPMVILTYNSPFFSDLDSSSFRALVASRAKVTVSDGNETEILTLTLDTNYFPSLVYEGNVLKGTEGNTYYLTVEDEVDTVHAITTIPDHPIIDSLWMEYINHNDTMGVLKARLIDNPTERNYYRTFTKIGNSNHFIATYFSCFDDQNFNGDTVILSLNRGSNSQLSLISNIYFRNDKSITLKISEIDKSSYDFWLAYQEAVLNSTSPFSSDHNQVISNTDKGLGVWCGYNSSYYAVIMK